MKIRLILTSFLILSLINISNSVAEDISVLFKRVQELSDQGNFSKALDELGWVRQELQKKHGEKIQAFLPDQVLDYKGQKPEANSALGFMNVQRTYKGNGSTIEVSLTGGSSGTAGGLGNLAQLGKMAAMFGGDMNNTETLRIGGRTANIDNTSGSPSLTIFLDSGSILKLDLKNGKDQGLLKTFAEALKIDDLDKYLKG